MDTQGRNQHGCGGRTDGNPERHDALKGGEHASEEGVIRDA
jgi:hypothetical protein